MKIKATLRNHIVVTVSLCYVLLFTYAAVSKLLDFESFSIQLGQSPLLSVFAGVVAIGVPVLELLIVALLSWHQWRVVALYMSFVLMVMFTAYIYIILHYSEFVPCSCGGILQKMGWHEHLIFNVIFIVLALIGMLLADLPDTAFLSGKRPLRFGLIVFGSAMMAIAAVGSLDLLSDDLIHTENSFIRRFPAHAEPEYNKIDLGYNSFYFAGISGDKIYLGNTTAAQVITIIDTLFKSKNEIVIKIDKGDFKFYAPQVAVHPPYFYLYDGLAPCIFSGIINDWQAHFTANGLSRSTAMIALDTTGFALRSASLISHSNTIRYYYPNKKMMSAAKFVLPAQVDGIFDTDGMLLYNSQTKKLHYVYYYRNQYLTFGDNLTVEREGRTIDTVSKANLKVVYTDSGESRMAAPPLQVNINATTYRNLLFVQSERIGKFEDEKMLRYASIIDVYDTTANTYISSMYVYKIGDAKLKSFRIYDNKLYTITGNYLSVVKLNDKIIAAMH